jgi:membrane protease YdiL (CAAX protease family)
MPGRSHPVKAFADRFPILFAVAFWIIYGAILFGIDMAFTFLPFGWPSRIAGTVGLLVELLFAVLVLTGLGWLRASGFNGPSQWRGMYVLWFPALIVLFGLVTLPFTVDYVYGPRSVIYAVIFALLTGLNEEACFRGVILQTLLPYGALAAALLSAVFFAVAHLNNLFSFGASPVVFSQVIWTFFFGFAYAAFRLRTRTLWPLILLHACNDIPTDVLLIASPGGAGYALPSYTAYIAPIVVNLCLAFYGLFLLLHRRSTASSSTTT